MSPQTKDLIVVKMTMSNGSNDSSADAIWEHLRTNVQGDAEQLTDDALASIVDLSKLRKYHKLNGIQWLETIKDKNIKQKEIETLILSGMALRGI